MVREQFIELLADPELSFLSCETKHGMEYAFDGLSLRINKTGFVIVGNAVDQYTFTSGHTFGRYKFTETNFGHLKDFLMVTKEIRRWRKGVEGFDVPEVIFALGENACFVPDQHEWRSGYLSIYAYYQFDSVNSNEMRRREIHQESGTREKFCGTKRNWLPKLTEFNKYFAEPFKPHDPEQNYAPINYLTRSDAFCFALLKTVRKYVADDPALLKMYGVEMPHVKDTVTHYVVQISRGEKNVMMGIFE